MKKLLWIIPVVIVFLSCKGQAADQNKLSVLIFHDSVIVYNGIIGKSTVYKKYLPAESEKLSETIEKHRHKYGPQSEIHLKIAYESSAGFTSLFEHIPDIVRQNSGPDLKMTDVSETEQQFFSIMPFKWSFIDSLTKPSTLELNMPMEEEKEVKVVQYKNSITCIFFASDSIYCYSGFNLAAGRFYSLKGDNTFRVFIAKENNRLGGRETVILKSSQTASYTNIVEFLDEMTINQVKKYAMAKLTDKEKLFLHINDSIK